MKKVLIAALFLAGVSGLFAQKKEKNPDLETWYHKDFSTTKIYGVNTQKAYEYFQSKGLKPTTIVVGVLDSGVEVDHPGLEKNIWINPKEIAGNGIDDDKNGYIDDIHGWNFLGGKNGDTSIDTMEATRVVKKYQDIFDSENSEENQKNKKSRPEEFQLYTKAKTIFTEKSAEARQNYQMLKMMKDILQNVKELAGDKLLTKDFVASLKPRENNQNDNMAIMFLNRAVESPDNTNKTGNQLAKEMETEFTEGIEYFEPQVTKSFNLKFDPRKEIVGDNYDDYSEKYYGNNHYEGPDASHGTHVAGIIAGYPHGNEVQYGVASKVAKIMSVRTVPDGDERDKDIANAIRYAVDNGARILNMSFGKALSPGKKYVWEAMKYAEAKGVLLVKAAGNENEDIEKNRYYPTNFRNSSDQKPFVKNMIVVGASTNDNTHLRAGFSNYNYKMVDVFAPGQDIYSTVPDAKYKYLQGTSMASPVVAGAAAVLLSYMPNLTPSQIIESLVKTVNVSTGNSDVEDVKQNTFDKISVAGGVIDTAKAAEYAYTHFYKKMNKTRRNSKGK